MRFLSVGPRICLQLPSESTSRWTPLLFSYTFPTTWACSGLSPARVRPWRANETCAARRTQRKKEPPREAPFFYNTYFLNTGILRSTHAVAVASASTTRQNAASSKINTACPAATDCTPHCSNTVKGVIFTNLYNRFTYTGCTRYTEKLYAPASCQGSRCFLILPFHPAANRSTASSTVNG